MQTPAMGKEVYKDPQTRKWEMKSAEIAVDFILPKSLEKFYVKTSR
jgi:hypothetical protein